MSWYNFYKNRIGPRYTEYCYNRYYPLIYILNDLYNKGHSIIEEGCGIGTISKIIKPSYSFDISPDMVKLSNLNGINAKVKTILEPFESDVLFSHGVIEHLSDSEIQTILHRNSYQVHYVPSNKYGSPSFGDERLMSPSEWKSKFNPSNIIEFNEGKDLILIWE